MTQASRPQSDNLSAYPFPSDPGPYSGDMWAELFGMLFTGDQQATQGPFVRYLNELEVTDNGSTTVSVDTGAGMVNGHALISSEQETWTIPAGPAGGRTDRVVMVENNTNAEVTQSTAGRPLLFPADLSEYTATPGVPPYAARLAILRGNDAGALPALDQTTALFMVELARYDINNVPTISAATDYREFCFFSSTIGERTLWVNPLWGDDGAATIYRASEDGMELNTGNDTTVAGFFTVPADYRGNLRSEGVILPTIPPGGANIEIENRAEYAACGEAKNTHTNTTGFVTTAVGTASVFACVLELQLSSLAIGDIVELIFERDATGPPDTYAARVNFRGWLVTYDAKS